MSRRKAHTFLPIQLKKWEAFHDAIRARYRPSDLAKRLEKYFLENENPINISTGTVEKAVSRILTGHGLLTDPLLLDAVLAIMNYPASKLFGVSPEIPDSQITGSSSMPKFEERVINSVKTALDERLAPRPKIRTIEYYLALNIVRMYLSGIELQDNDSCARITDVLFLCYSRLNHRLFPHNTTVMDLIDLLLVKYEKEKTNFTILEKSISNKLIASGYLVYVLTGLLRVGSLHDRHDSVSGRRIGHFSPSGIEISVFKKKMTDLRAKFHALAKTIADAPFLEDSQIEKATNCLVNNLCNIADQFLSPSLVINLRPFNNFKSQFFFFYCNLNQLVKPDWAIPLDKALDTVVDSTIQLCDEIINRALALSTIEQGATIYVVPENANPSSLPEDGKSWASSFRNIVQAFEYAKLLSKRAPLVEIKFSTGDFYYREGESFELPSKVKLTGCTSNSLQPNNENSMAGKTIFHVKDDRAIIHQNHLHRTIIESIHFDYRGKYYTTEQFAAEMVLMNYIYSALFPLNAKVKTRAPIEIATCSDVEVLNCSFHISREQSIAEYMKIMSYFPFYNEINSSFIEEPDQ